MIISHRHRYLFVEVPHTGSHSIAEQLIRHYDGEPILRKHANVTQFLGQAAAEEKSTSSLLPSGTHWMRLSRILRSSKEIIAGSSPIPRCCSRTAAMSRRSI